MMVIDVMEGVTGQIRYLEVVWVGRPVWGSRFFDVVDVC